MADNQLARWMGGSPFWVLMRLVLLSVVVGVILAALGLDPASSPMKAIGVRELLAHAAGDL